MLISASCFPVFGVVFVRSCGIEFPTCIGRNYKKSQMYFFYTDVSHNINVFEPLTYSERSRSGAPEIC